MIKVKVESPRDRLVTVEMPETVALEVASALLALTCPNSKQYPGAYEVGKAIWERVK